MQKLLEILTFSKYHTARAFEKSILRSNGLRFPHYRDLRFYEKYSILENGRLIAIIGAMILL